MKNIFFVLLLILVIFLPAACKSKPAPAPASETPGSARISTAAAAEPATAAPGSTDANAITPDTTSASTAGSSASGASSTTSSGSRHQSGVILDGASNYTVRNGDTMTGIAKQYYQDGSLYPLIMMVSSSVTDIDSIYPNMRLTIPALMVNMNDPTARESINRYFLQIAGIEERRGRNDTAALIRNHTR